MAALYTSLCGCQWGYTFLLAILKTLRSTFHLIFSDFMFIVEMGNTVFDPHTQTAQYHFDTLDNITESIHIHSNVSC